MIGVSGSLNFTQKIKEEVKEFLNNTLLLTLSDEKTKITHLETEKVKYLGFLISRIFISTGNQFEFLMCWVVIAGVAPDSGAQGLQSHPKMSTSKPSNPFAVQFTFHKLTGHSNH